MGAREMYAREMKARKMRSYCICKKVKSRSSFEANSRRGCQKCLLEILVPSKISNFEAKKRKFVPKEDFLHFYSTHKNDNVKANIINAKQNEIKKPKTMNIMGKLLRLV